MKKFLSVLIIIVLSMSVLVGCATEDETPPEDNNGIIDDNDTVPDEDNNDIDTEGNEGAWQDGTYTAETDPDERGWTAQIEITVQDGQISEVNFDEVNEEGTSKTEDEEYSQNMKAESGVAPAEAYEQLEEQLIELQNIEEIDAVTGATSTTERFKELAEEALATE